MQDDRSGRCITKYKNRKLYCWSIDKVLPFPALNYAEAQATESIGDFVHKLAVVLKELKECRIALKIIGKKELIKPTARLDDIFKETQALIAIIAKSISTSKKRKETSNPKAPKS